MLPITDRSQTFICDSSVPIGLFIACGIKYVLSSLLAALEDLAAPGRSLHGSDKDLHPSWMRYCSDLDQNALQRCS